MRDNFRPTFDFTFKFCVFVFGWLGLRYFARAFSACSEWALCFIVVCRLLFAASGRCASLWCAGFSLQRVGSVLHCGVPASLCSEWALCFIVVCRLLIAASGRCASLWCAGFSLQRVGAVLRCGVPASLCSEWVLCFIVVCRLLLTVPSLVAEPGFSVPRPRWLRLQALEHKLCSGTQALLP